MADKVPNQLYYGDNLDVLRLHIPDESVDLIYLDPPFNSNATYNVLFAEADGSRAASQIEAFGDTWQWDQASAAAFQEVLQAGGEVAKAMAAFQSLLGDSNLLAYLAMMAPRLIELKRVLKPTGTLFLHCDPTAGHYLKILLDSIFGPEHFLNEIIWHYTGGGRSKSYFSRKHDLLFWYSKSDKYTFNIDEIRVPYKETSGYAKSGITSKAGKKYMPNPKGTPVDDVWDIPIINPNSPERLGYPTQKPEALLKRIIEATTNEGDTVLDPFCGCGTTVAVSEKLNRQWIGIDITYLAVALMKSRLSGLNTESHTVDYELIGEPVSLKDARQLAKDDPYQFQWWALGLVGARPNEQKKGADKGIDGRIYFFDEGTKTKQVIISVKAGKVQVSHVRDLVGVLQRENAQIGVLISMNQPTGPMRQEAASARFYTSPLLGQNYPKIQLLTIEDLLDERNIQMPLFAGTHNPMSAQAPESPVVPSDQITIGEATSTQDSLPIVVEGTLDAELPQEEEDG